jgi:mRNA-degrading endonuclease RelE of RelBE toxin-antitoxin system
LPELRFTRRAKQDLFDLPPTIREAVLETVDLIAREPELAGKQLVGRLSGLWSTRVGNYRVLYTIEPSQSIVRAIRHRVVAYNRPE